MRKFTSKVRFCYTRKNNEESKINAFIFYNNSFSIKTDGTLWSWGNNDSGQLGLGDLNSRSSPVQVGSLTNWKSISCGNSTSLVIKVEGTLWGWGYNYYGELGLEIGRAHV